ncbi:Ubiquinone biosynthesis O-methyltransferase, mitochondrial [Exophiala dermatitidis]|uniref:Ubiquinone biosynthesis O-methyltransferase, mitochondrial n=2 Tax=Exophiala dermatitidis TaxID=5970 RepID=H6C7A4_EXODN|nr:3-demethylubiquinone-9 3-methyltransferase [Exophiala dermatitidis NIH/UT8656]KAJ4532833.1 Hexaprenyldihydroxybenzoate methyltransferase, mitochondrial [Exophiala dermatitidis]EHY59600.1 3-demethylubiquinone-9 3-methyltransferase [Exophiala dermatitidis NIH/UT8656]KAJ4573977.1 Hexaprenyldihydroxybenzoate methyltransferase, mitochondrial [Exophiala dermatitidis]KAJ4623926.1 Hexaprenyldihydroxybenzoate methyltransferase, mitochondrial [Exophiala dermatitidis]KAJ4699229.1 Hexaprenyldihydroxybe
MAPGSQCRNALRAITKSPSLTTRSSSHRVTAQTTRRDWTVRRIPRRQHSTASASPTSPSASSVSASEVSHFSRLASSWWDPHGPSRLLHLMNPLRHDFIRLCMDSSFSAAETTSTSTPRSYSYLDIGCGGGIFASSAARLPSTSTVTAIDPTELVIQVAKSHQRSDPAIAAPKLRYLNCAIEDLPVPATDEQKVDVLTVFEVLEHIDSPSSFLELAIPHVKPGGWIIGSTISRSLTAFLTTKLIAEAPLIGVVPPGTHDWNKYINPSELRQYFETRASGSWGKFKTQGVVYVPALGWRFVNNSEEFGNYFFGVQKLG